MKPINVILLLLAISSFTPLCDAFGFEVAAKARQCFFEYSEQNSLVGVMFQVTNGGFLDINIQVRIKIPQINVYKVKGPDDREIYSGERETEGRYSFNAHTAGLYSFCFDNSMSSLTSKTVQLDVTVTSANAEQANKANEDDPVKEQIELLESAITGIASDQKYLKMRQKAHKSSMYLRCHSLTSKPTKAQTKELFCGDFLKLVFLGWWQLCKSSTSKSSLKRSILFSYCS